MYAFPLRVTLGTPGLRSSEGSTRWSTRSTRPLPWKARSGLWLPTACGRSVLAVCVRAASRRCKRPAQVVSERERFAAHRAHVAGALSRRTHLLGCHNISATFLTRSSCDRTPPYVRETLCDLEFVPASPRNNLSPPPSAEIGVTVCSDPIMRASGSGMRQARFAEGKWNEAGPKMVRGLLYVFTSPH